jgi:hypothetical protein
MELELCGRRVAATPLERELRSHQIGVAALKALLSDDPNKRTATTDYRKS